MSLFFTILYHFPYCNFFFQIKKIHKNEKQRGNTGFGAKDLVVAPTPSSFAERLPATYYSRV